MCEFLEYTLSVQLNPCNNRYLYKLGESRDFNIYLYVNFWTTNLHNQLKQIFYLKKSNNLFFYKGNQTNCRLHPLSTSMNNRNLILYSALFFSTYRD